jgi:hypothetical protein
MVVQSLFIFREKSALYSAKAPELLSITFVSIGCFFTFNESITYSLIGDAGLNLLKHLSDSLIQKIVLLFQEILMEDGQLLIAF